MTRAGAVPSQQLWPRLCDFENLYYAWRDVRRGKANKVQVLRFESDLEGNLCSLWDDLAAGTYQPLPYTNFYVYEKKRRKISAADLRDRVVHHAYCNVVEPIFERRFVRSASYPARGTGKTASSQAEAWPPGQRCFGPRQTGVHWLASCARIRP